MDHSNIKMHRSSTSTAILQQISQLNTEAQPTQCITTADACHDSVNLSPKRFDNCHCCRAYKASPTTSQAPASAAALQNCDTATIQEQCLCSSIQPLVTECVLDSSPMAATPCKAHPQTAHTAEPSHQSVVSQEGSLYSAHDACPLFKPVVPLTKVNNSSNRISTNEADTTIDVPQDHGRTNRISAIAPGGTKKPLRNCPPAC